MNPKLYILHYADTDKHPILGCSNLFLNDLALRCVSSINEFADIKHDLIVIDNGSPAESHEDMIRLFADHGIDEEVIWIREKWHPPMVAAKAAIEDFLSSDSEQMAFFSSDTKIGPTTLSCGFKSMAKYLTPIHFSAPNMIHYGIGDIENYPRKEAWKKVLESPYIETFTSKETIDYFEFHRVRYVIDSWGEPAPISKYPPQGLPVGGSWNQLGSLFFANREAIESAGYPDIRYIRNDQYQYYDQAKKKGCKFSHMGYVYVSHLGALYRTGVGSFAPEQIKKYSPDPKHHNYAVDRPRARTSDQNTKSMV